MHLKSDFTQFAYKLSNLVVDFGGLIAYGEDFLDLLHESGGKILVKALGVNLFPVGLVAFAEDRFDGTF